MYRKDNFSVLGVVEDDINNLDKILLKFTITWPQVNVQDKDTNIEGYYIDYYPRTFLINPDGIIIHRDLRGENIWEKLKLYL